ncbi:MAG TPA: FHA domain-containing protein [Solirubrobacteraceae bacterium]|nr:FHA domain-containing protein [Solirubrobacteraceae bacterium]
MSGLAPVSVALKFGFLAVLYLFLLWLARSARRELRGGAAAPLQASSARHGEVIPPDATGMYSASAIGSADLAHRAPRLVIDRAPGHDPGMIYDLDGDLVLGRGERAEIRLEDPFASSRHARVYEQGTSVVIEDLGSTNGTYLNEELLESPRPLHPGDRVRIGDSEFTFEVD